MAKWQAGEWEIKYPPLKRNQALLDEISDLRDKIVTLRIRMEADGYGLTSVNVHESRYKELQNEVAEKIEKYASRAEAGIYKTKGNMIRRTSLLPHQAVIDYCIHDIDYLNEFIKAYSRGAKNG
jgi:hypothetical protein